MGPWGQWQGDLLWQDDRTLLPRGNCQDFNPSPWLSTLPIQNIEIKANTSAAYSFLRFVVEGKFYIFLWTLVKRNLRMDIQKKIIIKNSKMLSMFRYILNFCNDTFKACWWCSMKRMRSLNPWSSKLNLNILREFTAIKQFSIIFMKQML